MFQFKESFFLFLKCADEECQQHIWINGSRSLGGPPSKIVKDVDAISRILVYFTMFIDYRKMMALFHSTPPLELA